MVALSLTSGNTTSCGCLHREMVRRLGHARALELAGQVFGRLTVLHRENSGTPRGGMDIRWHCRCACGKELDVRGKDLRAGQQSCGCLNRESRVRNLAGQVFGHLAALQLAGKDRNGRLTWRCRCACGREVVVRGNTLTNGETKSCGCRREPTKFDLLGTKVTMKEIAEIAGIGISGVSWRLARGMTAEQAAARRRGSCRKQALELLGPDLDPSIHRKLVRMRLPRRDSVAFWIYWARCAELISGTATPIEMRDLSASMQKQERF